MKTFKTVLAGLILFFTSLSYAQVNVHVTIGSPPQWGPVGYSNVRYYYIPDVQAYYDIDAGMFIYFESGIWIHRTYLPYRYRNYNLYSGYKVVMTTYRGNQPYIYYYKHKNHYKPGYHGKPQTCIGKNPGHSNSKAAPNKQGNKKSTGNPGNVKSNSHSKSSSPVKNTGHSNPVKQNKNAGQGGSHGKGGSGGKGGGKK